MSNYNIPDHLVNHPNAPWNAKDCPDIEYYEVYLDANARHDRTTEVGTYKTYAKARAAAVIAQTNHQDRYVIIKAIFADGAEAHAAEMGWDDGVFFEYEEANPEYPSDYQPYEMED